MRTNIELDDKMVKKAMKFSKARTKREVVDMAIREFVATYERRSAFEELFGSGGLDPDYDYKAARTGRAA